MKWIKLFEGFNTEDYYKEITYLEYCNSDGVNFEQKYYDKLNRYYRDEVFRDGDDILMVKSGYYVNIYQTDDEWFLVYMRTPSDEFYYFKCDQYEGLIKCLDEEIKEHYE